MSSKDSIISVGIYFRGNNLNPALITEMIGILPSESQYKGEERTTSTNYTVKAKIGIWAIISNLKSCRLSDHIDHLTLKFAEIGVDLDDLPGVQEKYVDVFFASDADEAGECTCEFQLSRKNVSALGQLGIAVRFTVTTGRP